MQDRRHKTETAKATGAVKRGADPRDANSRDANPRDAKPRDAKPRDAKPRDAKPRDSGQDLTLPSLFFACPPGLETPLAEEASALGFGGTRERAGGVEAEGDVMEAARAALFLRGASRVLLRIDAFYVSHLAQLDKRARQVPWARYLRPGAPITVTASCARSRIQHSGAVEERIARAAAAALETADGGAAPDAAEPTEIQARIERNHCVISLDAGGPALHKRGAKEAVGKAPMRETMAALFLRACGYRGTEPMLDPFCGSGTFVLEAADMAAGLPPGRRRALPAERFAAADPEQIAAWRASAAPPASPPPLCWGSDRDPALAAAAAANAERAGLAASSRFQPLTIGDVQPPPGPPGLVIANPPYGARLGDKRALFGLYTRFGQVMRERFSGWRVGVVTSDRGLARATGLTFAEIGPTTRHGGVAVTLYQTEPLPPTRAAPRAAPRSHPRLDP